MMADGGLTPKQARFVEEYLVDLNAAAAARRAGYSKRTSEVIGCENLRKPKVADAIAAAQKARSARTGIKQDRVIKELARVALPNLLRVMKWGPNGVELIDSKALSEDDTAALALVSQTRRPDGGSAIRVKLHDKNSALDKLCRHLGLYDSKEPDKWDARELSEMETLIRRAAVLNMPSKTDPGEGPSGS